MGVWKGNCDICKAVDVPCADAGHDFGVYEFPKEEASNE